MTSENDAEFVEIMMQDGDWQPGSRMHRLALLARRGADAADRIEQLEAEVHEQVQWVKDLADLQIKAEARIEQLEAALDILQAAMTAKKPIPMAFKKAILEARAALGEDRT